MEDCTFLLMLNIAILFLFTQVIRGSGLVRISGNNLVGSVKLNDFSMSLKWSDIGNLRMYLIQVLSVII